ncbi:MAG: hypothetical protein RJA36_3843, partial [Pseudomonadota bacterium]
MSTFLNVVGILSLLGGIVLFFIQPQLAGAAIMDAVLCLGLARLIEQLRDAANDRSKRVTTQADQHKQLLAAIAASQTSKLPPAPGALRYYSALGATVQGPHDADTVLKLVERDAIPADGHIIAEGWSEWL